MTEKRFTFDEDINEDDMYELGVFLDNREVMNTTDVLDLLNEQHETIQSIKNILNELNNIEEFWDSALLQKYIDKIAVEIGVDLE